MDSKRSLLTTIRYSDIFDFPVTLKEIWTYFIGSSSVRYDDAVKELKKMIGKEISYKKPYFCLKGREHLYSIRKKRLYYSKLKLYEFSFISRFFSYIPTIMYVGISGSVARMNADEDDDIDLFIISREKTVWVTRLVVLAYLQFRGKRRAFGQTSVKNKICVNFLVDMNHLLFPSDKHDIYTAYEIAQLKHIFDRDNTYAHFVRINRWMKQFLPHIVVHSKSKSMKSTSVYISIGYVLLRLLEPMARTIQLLVLQKHKTTEIVSPGLAAFHPHDCRPVVIKNFIIQPLKRHLKPPKSLPYGTLTKIR